MAWGKATSVDGDGTSAFSSSTFTPSDFMMILNFTEATTALNDYFRVGNTTIDSGSNYAWRSSQNGGADSTGTSRSEGLMNQSATSDAGEIGFRVIYAVNIATEEKLFIHHIVDNVASGAGTAPNRREATNKWANTSNQIDIVGSYTVSGTYNANSNISVLGSDLTPAAAGAFPTNVQLGSRAEITDTRKIYYLSNMSTSGLKAYYNFDSIDSSTTLTNQATTGDGLGSSADGTVTNATLDTTNEKLGTGCYNFDGTGDKVALGSSTTTLDFLTTGNSDWTVSFWLKLNATEPDGNNAILCQGQGNEAGLDILFDDRSAESRDHVLGVRLEGNSGNTAMKLYTSAQFIPKDTDWHHYVITGDVSTRTVTAYRDGGNAESDSTGSGNFPTTLARKPTFGVHPTSGFNGADLNAKLDDCSLWSRILTSDEISLLYNSGTGATPYTTKTWQEIGV